MVAAALALRGSSRAENYHLEDRPAMVNGFLMELRLNRNLK
jgi:hypothetical protein